MKNEIKYESNLKDLKEERHVHTEDKEIVIKYEHQPSIVGPRSEYHGLPIWVGKTNAEAFVNGKSIAKVEAKCWSSEPFTYSRARVVTTGRILKKLKLPRDIALMSHIRE